ncbi:hypothetical protein AB0F43_24750 [Kribbella sp. NPDC023972]
MRNPALGSSQSGAFPRLRRDEWRTAQTRPVRNPVVNSRRGNPRRGAR